MHTAINEKNSCTNAFSVICQQFTAMIRLPDQLNKKEKMKKMNELIDVLDLRHCVDTGK